MGALNTLVATLRGLHVAALVSLFGTLLFMLVIANHARLQRLARISAMCALLFGVAWLAVDAAAIADADSIASTLRAVPVVALQTQYGQWFVFRCVLLIGAAWLPYSRRVGLIGALALAGVALAVQPLLGHAGASGGRTLIASETLHLLAAGAWLGGLLPLFIAVSILPHEDAVTACRAFTPIGLAAVLLLVGTAVEQVAELIGGPPGLFGTTYGHVALVKLGLLAGLLALAALNRFVFTERLAHGVSCIQSSILIEAVLGAAVVVAAGFLASLMPGTHEQPVWPFPWRPSLSALFDPYLRRELLPALVAFGMGLGLMIIALPWRRIRWYALIFGLLLVVISIPHFDLLFVEAYPTSFFTSPTEFAATAIVQGSRLFAANCTTCHGTDARGDGPAAKSLPLPPADLTAEHFWAHSEGELYWFVSHGLTAPDGNAVMPGFGGRLSSEAIWDLIDFLRAHNAGETMRTTGVWTHPVQVPQFDAACPGGKTLDLDDLRGHMLRIVAAADNEPAVQSAGATTIFLTRRRMNQPIGDACVANEPQTWMAFAIILGQAPDQLAGWQILVDSNGWLRLAWHPGAATDWNDPGVLAAAIDGIEAHPLAVGLAAGHVHRH
jgi:putative copper export protein/mono/diheme cytochrome c family protein